MALRRRGSLPFGALSANRPDGEGMSQQFPLVYGMSRSWKIFCGALGALMGMASIACALYFGFFYDKDDFGIGLTVVLSLLLALLAVPCIGSVLRTRVVVHPDYIEGRSFLRTRRMNRADIAGFRIVPTDGSPVRLESRTPDAPPLTLPPYIAYDARMDAWLAGTTNYVARELQTSLDSILADPDLAVTNDEKLAQLAAARRVARRFFFGALAMTAWVWFYPRPYDLAVATAVLLPWVALVVVAQQGALYRLNPLQNDAGADMSSAFFLPSASLAIRALYDFKTFDAWKLFWISLAVTAACMAVLHLLAREFRGRFGSLLLYGVLLTGYGYGTVSVLNARLDDSAPQHFPARLIDDPVKRSSGKTFDVHLAPWGPQTTDDDFRISRDLFERVKKGDTVCVYLWPGALGVRLYEVSDCPKD
jgi:hypothetical protein